VPEFAIFGSMVTSGDIQKGFFYQIRPELRTPGCIPRDYLSRPGSWSR